MEHLKKLLFASLFSIKVVPTGVTIMINKYKKHEKKISKCSFIFVFERHGFSEI